MANQNTPKALATIIGQLAFVGTRVQQTNRIYINAVDQMLMDIANVQGTTGGQGITPCMQVWTGKSSYEPAGGPGAYGGSTGIALLILDEWETQPTLFDVIWDRLETDLQTAIHNIMGNQSLVQNGQAHAVAVHSVSVDEYQHKQTIQLGNTYYVYRQTGFSIDVMPWDEP